MKKIIGYIGSYLCFWIGAFFAKIMYKIPILFFVVLYQRFMEWSWNLQDWAKLDKPWKEVKKEENDINTFI